MQRKQKNWEGSSLCLSTISKTSLSHLLNWGGVLIYIQGTVRITWGTHSAVAHCCARHRLMPSLHVVFLHALMVAS